MSVEDFVGMKLQKNQWLGKQCYLSHGYQASTLLRISSGDSFFHLKTLHCMEASFADPGPERIQIQLGWWIRISIIL